MVSLNYATGSFNKVSKPKQPRDSNYANYISHKRWISQISKELQKLKRKNLDSKGAIDLNRNVLTEDM